MTEKIKMAEEEEKVRMAVEHCVDYLWLMRSFEEELAKEARDLLKGFRARKHARCDKAMNV